MHKTDDNKEGDIVDQPANHSLEVAGLDALPPQRGNKRIRKLKTLRKTERPLFENSPIERMATGAPVISATQAYLKPPDWSEDAKDSLCFPKVFGKGRHIEFYILNNQEHQPEFITQQAQQEILKHYGARAARLHAVFASYAVRQKEPWRESFTLLGSNLIKLLQFHKGNKLKKPQKLKDIADLACILGTLGAKILWQEGNLNLSIIERSLIWSVNVKEYYQNDLSGNPNELIEVEVRVQPGLWTQSFLNKEGAQQGKALCQYGFLPKQLFDIDPHRQKLAANLALYVIQNSRAHKSGVYTISSLLGNVLSQAEIEQAANDYRYGWKLKETVDEAMLVLRDKLSLEIEFDEDTFPMWLRPLWAMPDTFSHLPTRERHQHLLGARRLPDNYIQNRWFLAKLTFKLPALIQQRLDEFEARKGVSSERISKHQFVRHIQSAELNICQSFKAPPETMKSSGFTQVEESAELTGAMVRGARIAIGMSQRDVAHAIRMSQSWVRDIEKNGEQKLIPLQYSLKLREVLGIA